MKKSIFLFFAAILCAMSVSAAIPSKLYLDASDWGYSDARYAAYFMPQNSFVDMTKATGEVSVFEVAVPASQTKVIFVRMNGSKPANDWANKWNQTGDLTIPIDGKNKFKPSGWDGATTTWSTYTYTPPTFYIAGDFVTPNWSENAAANKMDYADGVFSKSYDNVAASAHQFKITNGTWNNAVGYSSSTCSGTNCTVENGGGNIKFTPLAEGTVTITYTLADGKVHITCPEPPAVEYNITYPATQTNYTLVTGPAKAQAGAEVSFTATPADGYVLNVTYNGNAITGNNNVYAFMMPAADVTIAIEAVAATTLYYVDHNSWGNANAYMWNDSGNNGWPGAAMALVGTVGDNAYSYYSISFAQGAYTSIIFNDGDDSQTADLTINTAKPYFYDGAWYTWDELLAKLAAPVVTYDYYLTGSLVGGWEPKQQGIEKDGELYKATFNALAAGTYEFKITAGDWEHQWNYNNLGAAYEEVSQGVDGEGNPNGNIKIVTEEIKNITVIFDATAGKITFEGLTEKTPVEDYYTIVGATAITGVNWDLANEDNKMTKSGEVYTLTKTDLQLEAGDYEYKVAKNGAWNNGQYPAEGNQKVTIAENGVYTIVYTYTVGTSLTAEPTKTGDYTPDKPVYTVAGDAALCGTNWKADDTTNDMTDNGDGTFTWTKTGVKLTGDAGFKVVKNHDFEVAYPADNWVIKIADYDGAAIYTVTITFTESSTDIVVTLTKTGDAAPAVVTYVLMGVNGDWTTGIPMTENPDKAGEYKLTCQAISATDAVKVVKLTDGVKTDYYGNGTVKDGVEVAVNYDGDGNITLPEGTYDFYFDTNEAEKKLWIAAATYTRDVTPGSFSTICLPYAGTISGATLFNLSDRDETYVYVVEAGTKLEAGKPYVILPTEDKITVTYKNYDYVAAGIFNTLQGTYEEMNADQLNGKYVITGNKYYYVDKVQSAGSKLLANRAYFNLYDLPTAPASAPGARRIALGTNGQNTATGMENVDASAQPVKTIINGQLFILRGEKMYDAQGKLVK